MTNFYQSCRLYNTFQLTFNNLTIEQRRECAHKFYRDTNNHQYIYFVDAENRNVDRLSILNTSSIFLTKIFYDMRQEDKNKKFMEEIINEYKTLYIVHTELPLFECFEGLFNEFDIYQKRDMITHYTCIYGHELYYYFNDEENKPLYTRTINPSHQNANSLYLNNEFKLNKEKLSQMIEEVVDNFSN